MHVNDIEFGFIPGCGITNAMFVVRQLQEKFHAINMAVYVAFVELEKVFSRVPRLVLWCALRMLGIERMAGVYHREYVKCQKQRMCWLQPEWKVQCESESSLRLLSEPPTVYQGTKSWKLSAKNTFVQNVPGKTYANDWVIILESLEELQGNMIFWK